MSSTNLIPELIAEERYPDLSDAHKTALAEFRAAFKDDAYASSFDEHFFWRFLSAREYNQGEASEMLTAHLKWRKMQGCDTILVDYKPPEVLDKFLNIGFFGEDKTGCPVKYDRVGICDVRGLMRSASKSEILKYRVAYLCEVAVKRCKEQSEKHGKLIDRITFVLDMGGFGLKNIYRPWMKLVGEAFRTIEQNYPQLLQRVVIINPPGIFPYAFSLLSRFMNERTRRKFVVCKGDYRPVLAQLIDAQFLCKQYGGAALDPNTDEPGAPYFSGGDVPESFYRTEIDMTEEFQEIEISRGSTHHVEVEVKEPGHIIKWEFRSVDYDVGFGLFRKDSSARLSASEMEEIVPNTRVDSHVVPEIGVFTVEKPGIYVLRFDNTFSLIRPKTVRFTHEVLAPSSPEN